MTTPAGPPYNKVVKIPIEVYWWRGLRVARYRATFYNSAYGAGCVSAFTRRACEKRFRLLVAEFMVGS